MKAFDAIRQAIMHTSARDFEKLCLQLLEYFYPTIEQSEDMQTYDRAGFDLVVRAAGDPYKIETIFQCKTAQEGFNKTHLKKCLGSIKAFKESGFEADTYYFIFNKPIQDQDFRDQLADKLEELKLQQLIGAYELLDADELIQFLLSLAARELATRINNNGPLFYDRYTIDDSMHFYIEDIPFRANTQPRDNPVEYLLEQLDCFPVKATKKHPEFFFLLREFGFGKTTLLLEFSRRIDLCNDGRGCIFMPATILEPEAFANEDSFLDAVVAVLSPFRPQSGLLDILNREVLRTFLNGSADVIVLIDGLDEHKYFKDFTVLKKMFNSIKGIAAPIVFSMRSEYYKDRVVDLEMALKGIAGKARKLTLTDWSDEHILHYLRSYKKRNKPVKKEAQLLSGFMKMIESGQYQQQLGDIPKRPLFLSMILADVVGGTMLEGKITLAQLYEKYILQKIQRDLEGSISELTPDRGVDMAGGFIDFSHGIFQLLQRITIYMYFEIDNKLSLSNSVSIERARELIRDTPFQHVLDLSLHSVIVPVEEKYDMDTHVKFAHFSFLEFFFASNLVLNLSDEEYYLDIAADDTVLKFAREIAQKKWSPAKWKVFRSMKFENKKGIGYRPQKAAH